MRDTALASFSPRLRPRARLLDGSSHRALNLFGRKTGRAFPALVTLGQRPTARKQLFETLVRGREDGLVGVGRPHPVKALHFVGVGAGLARQHAGVGTEASDLVAQPAVLELGEQRLCLGHECPRLHRRRRVDRGCQLSRPEVGVDHSLDVAAELQPQPEVALNR